MEDEDEAQTTQKIDFCTMGMFIIGEIGFHAHFMPILQLFHRCLLHAKLLFVYIRTASCFQMPINASGVYVAICTAIRHLCWLFGSLAFRSAFITEAVKTVPKICSRSGDLNYSYREYHMYFYKNSRPPR